jgi:hypothetical protein
MTEERTTPLHERMIEDMRIRGMAATLRQQSYTPWISRMERAGSRSPGNLARLPRGVRPCRWTGSGGGFDRAAGVAVLELDGAEIAQGGV